MGCGGAFGSFGAGYPAEIVTRPKIPWTMMLEYVGRPAETAEAFRNCWFHTGDIGYFDDDGYLFYVDRKRDALRRRAGVGHGHRISP